MACWRNPRKVTLPSETPFAIRKKGTHAFLEPSEQALNLLCNRALRWNMPRLKRIVKLSLTQHNLSWTRVVSDELRPVKAVSSDIQKIQSLGAVLPRKTSRNINDMQGLT